MKNNFKCINCKNIIPLPEKNLKKNTGLQKQVLQKFCVNCKIESPRQSMRPGKAGRK